METNREKVNKRSCHSLLPFHYSVPPFLFYWFQTPFQPSGNSDIGHDAGQCHEVLDIGACVKIQTWWESGLHLLSHSYNTPVFVFCRSMIFISWTRCFLLVRTFNALSNLKDIIYYWGSELSWWWLKLDTARLNHMNRPSLWFFTGFGKTLKWSSPPLKDEFSKLAGQNVLVIAKWIEIQPMICLCGYWYLLPSSLRLSYCWQSC